MTYYVVPRRYGGWVRYRPVGFNGGRRLPLDVHASGDEFVISAPVPGIKAEDLKIQILDDVVTLRADVEEQASEPESTLLREIPQGGFERSLRLPAPLDAQHAEAKIEDGLLTLRIPKAEEARPRTIQVKAR
jgi:HSP20 family protein